MLRRLRSIVHLFMLGLMLLVAGCDSADPLSDADPLVGTWTLQTVDISAVVTTSQPDRVFGVEAANNGLGISGLSDRLRYVEYTPGGVLSDDYEDAHHQITLYTHPPLETSPEFPHCMLNVDVSERIWGAPTAPEPERPHASLSCVENEFDYSSFTTYEDVAVTFDADRLVVDLADTRFRRSSATRSILGDEVVVGGRFEGAVIAVPARTPTRIPIPRTAPSLPVQGVDGNGATLLLKQDGRYESTYALIPVNSGDPDVQFIERGRWASRDGQLLMTPQEVNGRSLRDEWTQPVSFNYESNGPALTLRSSIEICGLVTDSRECLNQAGSSLGLQKQGSLTVFTYELSMQLDQNS